MQKAQRNCNFINNNIVLYKIKYFMLRYVSCHTSQSAITLGGEQS